MKVTTEYHFDGNAAASYKRSECLSFFSLQWDKPPPYA